ncbi:hypothetical protein [Dickeya oryzae]
MAINFNDGRHGVIKSRDLRVCRFYANWLQANNIINTSSVSRQNGESCRQALNHIISQYFPDKEKQFHLLSDMDIACEENILSLDDLTGYLRMKEPLSGYGHTFVRREIINLELIRRKTQS